MRKRIWSGFLAALRGGVPALAAVAVVVPADDAQAQPEAAGHIVVFHDHADPDLVARAVGRRHGVGVGGVFRHAIRGMYIPHDLPEPALQGIANNPHVAWVEPNQVATTTDASVTELPNGFRRVLGHEAVELDPDFQADVDVAIFDTGVDADHPDLNVVHEIRSYEVTNGPPRDRGVFIEEGPGVATDLDGHGTHVAGTAAARYNADTGMIGVAPGARVWAAKVLNDNGSGTYAQIIEGIDFLVEHYADQVDIANMSLGGGYSQALNDAVDAASDAGILFVVAAGNSSDDADWYSPASAASAVTVSAITDRDGLPGGLAGGDDDTFASYSNWGPAVDIAAPGTDIFSTRSGGGYTTMTGTSMSSPLVAGAAALRVALSQDDPSVQDLHDLLTQSGWQEGDDGYFTGDPDNYPEPLLNVSALVSDLVDSDPPKDDDEGKEEDDESSDDGDEGSDDDEGKEEEDESSDDDGDDGSDDDDGKEEDDESSDDDDGKDDDESSDDDGDEGKDEDDADALYDVTDIAYWGHGGRTNDRHLSSELSVVDEGGSPASDVHVYAEVRLDGEVWGVLDAFTDEVGVLGWSYNHAPSGCYTTVGVELDGEPVEAPANEYCK